MEFVHKYPRKRRPSASPTPAATASASSTTQSRSRLSSRVARLRRITSRIPTRLSLPRLHRPSRKQLTLLALASIAAFAFIYSSRVPVKSRSTQPSKQTQAATTDDSPRSGSLTKGTPDYSTVAPEGKTIESLGGWTRVSPPDRNPVFAFSDTIGAIPVTVSEQPLPDDFRSDTATQVEDLAKGYSATRFITAGDTKVYIGTSAKGPQSIILTKNGLLILIKASATIPDDSWKAYVTTLR